MDFPEFTMDQELKEEFQFIISKILGHHNQGWSGNLRLKLFLSIYLLMKLIVLWTFRINSLQFTDLKHIYYIYCGNHYFCKIVWKIVW